MGLGKLFERKSVKVTNLEFNSDVTMSPELERVIEETLNWEHKPHLLTSGRSAYLLLDELGLGSVGYNGISSSCLKIKGLGNVKEKRGKLVIEAPGKGDYISGSKGHFRGHVVHTGTDAEGNIIPIFDRARIKGGMKVSYARNEYEITKGAIEQGVPMSIPVAWGSFDNNYKGEQLGFVVLGSRDDRDRRMNLILELCENLNSLPEEHQKQVPGMLKNLRREQGRSLRKFHKAGYARHAGHDGNFSYDEKSNEMIILDTDSSIALSSIDLNAVFMTRTLDVMSSLRGIHGAICRGFVHTDLNVDDMRNQYFSFLEGYFCNIGNKGGKLRTITNRLWDEANNEYAKKGIMEMNIMRESISNSKGNYSKLIKEVAKLEESQFRDYIHLRMSFTVFAIDAIFNVMQSELKREGISPPYRRKELQHHLSLYVDKFMGMRQEYMNSNPHLRFDENPFEIGLLAKLNIKN
ncbi:MAG: hypothetical protein KAQ83_02245 [Nanoarchaeota archaeon]|nr:hypothetical protein [Nanoarchaeota archaeon]